METNLNTDQEVILVNEQNEAIGKMEKMEAHRKAQLHRAFSVFIFNSKGEMLLHQRALNKYHSGGLWTNACCSHPSPGEETLVAASRRLKEEMGFNTNLREAFHFIYKAGFENGLTEYEFDHVYIGVYDGPVKANADEVKDYCFKPMDAIDTSLITHPQKYTPWFRIAFPKLEAYMQTHPIN
jgi:isopentenyl-diphosphate delta-isomerase